MELPLQLLDALKHVSGFNADLFVQAHQESAPISIRFNPAKPYLNTFLKLDYTVPWSAYGFYLAERPKFTLDPAMHAGAYYVQEASSMFVEYVLNQVLEGKEKLSVLDLCAAPGGKTTLLASMPQFELVVANEIIRARVNILYENAVKWGDPKIIVSNNDPSVFSRMGPMFDVMVIDAPCSGSGLFRKDPDAIKEWSPNNVQLCSERQKRILADALPALHDNGILVYSTCSYSPEEDEEILDWLMGHSTLDPLEISIPEEWEIEKSVSEKGGIGYRFFPGKAKGEGFFISCFRKQGLSSVGRSEDHRSYEKTKFHASLEKAVKGWVDFSNPWIAREKDQEIFLLPSNVVERVQTLEKYLSLRKSGVRAGSLIRDQFIPDHELILSQYLDRMAASIDLDGEEALRYLRKQDLLPGSTAKGWYYVRYQGLALGLIKHLGNRVNNYYPASWRILMS